ncbi:MAG: GDP-L-fucose synthase family protein [Thermoleophilia bacterium]
MSSSSWSRIYVAGHTGLVGGAVCRALARRGYRDVITRSSAALNLRDQAATAAFIAAEKPDVVIIAAARVGGIIANWENPYEFVAENLAIELNLIDAAFRQGCQRLIFLGSSCIYPREAPQPLREEYLLSGPLEETNRPYAIAKISGIELCRSLNREYGTDYLSVMPTNLYGPGDNFDLRSSHVLPALIRRFHEAKGGGVARDGVGPGDGAGSSVRRQDAAVTLWGSGRPRREFLHVDDLAEAVVFLMEEVPANAVPDALINVGCGQDSTISELAELVQRVVGHNGAIAWDASKPDGTPQKLLDVSRITQLGWQPKIGLEEGIRTTYAWFVEHYGASSGSGY